jgi:hypothetical protein
MSSTNRQRGKAHQKKVAEMLNGIDIGILGGEDVLTDDFSIECKSGMLNVSKTIRERRYLL